MKRNFVRAGAIAGVAALATLVAGPTMAAAGTSQATAQSLVLTIGTNSVVKQSVSATNDGTQPSVTNSSTDNTIPALATVLGGTNLLATGVAPAVAIANPDGTSGGCSGIAGSGTAVLNVGTATCTINGGPIGINVGTLSLGNGVISSGALGSAICTSPLATLLCPGGQLPVALQGVVAQVASGLSATPLGSLAINGSLGVINGVCTATTQTAVPQFATSVSGTSTNAATADSHVAGINLGITLPAAPGGSPTTLSLLNVPVDVAPNTPILSAATVQAIENALLTEINTVVQGQLAPLASALGTALSAVQTNVVNTLFTNLQPVLAQLGTQLLSGTLNAQSYGDAGRSVSVTALDLTVLPGTPAAIHLTTGHATCGPNAAIQPASNPTTGQTTANPTTAALPKHVESGKGGAAQSMLLVGSSALLAASAGAGLMAYRRYGMPRG